MVRLRQLRPEPGDERGADCLPEHEEEPAETQIEGVGSRSY